MQTCSRQHFNILASLCSLAGWLESYTVRNPEDMFSHARESCEWRFTPTILSWVLGGLGYCLF